MIWIVRAIKPISENQNNNKLIIALKNNNTQINWIKIIKKYKRNKCLRNS